jgi:hypothetical protein
MQPGYGKLVAGGMTWRLRRTKEKSYQVESRPPFSASDTLTTTHSSAMLAKQALIQEQQHNGKDYRY